MAKKMLFSIYYYDGESDQVEVVLSEEKPTNAEALRYILLQVEGIDETEIGEYDYILINDVYPTAVHDFQTGQKITNVIVDFYRGGDEDL